MSTVPSNQLQIPISDVHPCLHATDLKLKAPVAYRRFIEAPVRSAVVSLNEKGIVTVSSSANLLDIGKIGHVALVYDTLSPTNKEVANRLITEQKATLSSPFERAVLVITFPIHGEDLICDVENRVLALCSRFEAQRNFR